MTIATSLEEELLHKINYKTKPPGSLGVLEDIALQAGRIQQTISPKVTSPHILVFAADHGIAATGLVNPYPQSVTAQMVLNFINGGAAINVFCRQHAITLKVIDSGVNHDFVGIASSPLFIDAKTGYGTRNYLHGEAMMETEVQEAIEKGKKIIQQVAGTGCNTIGLGEMGIGNTSSASLLMSGLLQLPIEACTGRGAGVSDQQLLVKTDTLKKVYEIHGLAELSNDPVTLLTRVGGFEIAMMVGAYLEAAAQKMIIVVDGFITTAALLVAHKLQPGISDYCIFAHTSGENGHTRMLEHLNAKPLLHLGLRLGEGTGAALAIPLVQSSVDFLNHMASFETAGVTNKDA